MEQRKRGCAVWSPGSPTRSPRGPPGWRAPQGLCRPQTLRTLRGGRDASAPQGKARARPVLGNVPPRLRGPLPAVSTSSSRCQGPCAPRRAEREAAEVCSTTSCPTGPGDRVAYPYVHHSGTPFLSICPRKKKRSGTQPTSVPCHPDISSESELGTGTFKMTLKFQVPWAGPSLFPFPPSSPSPLPQMCWLRGWDGWAGRRAVATRPGVAQTKLCLHLCCFINIGFTS